jgi:hypothetical protein
MSIIQFSLLLMRMSHFYFLNALITKDAVVLGLLITILAGFFYTIFFYVYKMMGVSK